MRALMMVLMFSPLVTYADLQQAATCMKGLHGLGVSPNRAISVWSGSEGKGSLVVMAPKHSNNWGLWVLRSNESLFCKLPAKPIVFQDRRFYALEISTKDSDEGAPRFIEFADCISNDNCRPTVSMGFKDVSALSMIQADAKRTLTTCQPVKENFPKTVAIKEIKSQISGILVNFMASATETSNPEMKQKFVTALEACSNLSELTSVVQKQVAHIEEASKKLGSPEPQKTAKN